MKRRSVVIPLQLPSVANMREHWAKKAKRAKVHRMAAFVTLMSGPGEQLLPPIVITITRIAPRQLDGDNLQSACKNIRDGVADWLCIDDGSKGLTWNYAQRKGLAREHAVQIDVEDAA